jgi:cytochrome b561
MRNTSFFHTVMLWIICALCLLAFLLVASKALPKTKFHSFELSMAQDKTQSINKNNDESLPE